MISMKLRYSRSFASSYYWNRRNIEHPWYATWNTALTLLTEEFPNICVAPQYPLWFEPNTKESQQEEMFDEEVLLAAGHSSVDISISDGEDDSADPINLFNIPDSPLPPRQSTPPMRPSVRNARSPSPLIPLDQEIDNSLLDHSMAELTLEDGTSIRALRPFVRHPDFVLLHFLAVQLPQTHSRYDRLAGLSITHECSAVIVEVKKFPARDLQGAELIEGVRSLLEIATDDLGIQCVCAFKKFPRMQKLLGIVASGDFFRHTIVNKSQVIRFEDVSWETDDDLEYGEKEDRHKTDTIFLDDPPLQWSPIAALGSPTSTAEMDAIREYLRTKTKPPEFP